MSKIGVDFVPEGGVDLARILGQGEKGWRDKTRDKIRASLR